MEDDMTKKGTPPPFTIKIRKAPPFHINLDTLNSNSADRITDVGSQSAPIQEQTPIIAGGVKPPWHINIRRDDVDSYEEVRLMDDTQTTTDTYLNTTSANQVNNSSPYNPISPDAILPQSVSYPQTPVPLQAGYSNFYNTSYQLPEVTESDFRKLAYQKYNADILIGKAAALEDIRTKGALERSLISINEDNQKSTIEVNKKILLNQAEYLHKKNMTGLSTQGVVRLNASSNTADINTFIRNFIYQFQLVALKIEFEMKSDFYCLNSSGKLKVGHFPITEKSLENLFTKHLKKFLGDDRFQQYKFSELFDSLKDSIPVLGSDDCTLQQLRTEEQIFNNGLYNVFENSFMPFQGNERFWGRFPIDVDFIDRLPDIFPFNTFDEMLDDIFDGDMNKINLLYQIIGAVLSNLSLKHIFVFQGVSNSGKTAITEIICHLLGKDNYLPILDLSELNDYTPADLNSYKLLVVQDAPDKPITSKQLSLLRNFADGSQFVGLRNFKIIINTNNSIFTSKDTASGQKFLSQALAKRLVVLPFEKSMDRTNAKVDDKAYLDSQLFQERAYIISRALVLFSHYFDKIPENNRPLYQFCADFPINAILDENIEII